MRERNQPALGGLQGGSVLGESLVIKTSKRVKGTIEEVEDIRTFIDDKGIQPSGKACSRLPLLLLLSPHPCPRRSGLVKI